MISSDANGRLLLEKEMSYWKAYNSVHDVLASELSYSLLYDNINPEKVGAALATVGMDTLPNRFFLIQVDDYQNYASRLRLTQEFFQKISLINLLRECMRNMKLRGFMANLIGMETFICFLCCEEQEGPEIHPYLLSVAELFKKSVRARSPLTISVCISERCDRLVSYSRMYPDMNLALSKTYFSGKELSMLLADVKGDTNRDRQTAADINAYYPELLISIARYDREHFDRVVQKMIEELLKTQTRPQKARLEMIRLIGHVEEYCIRCGVPEAKMNAYSEAAISQILSCSFIFNTKACFLAYFEQVAPALMESGVEEGYSFQIPVLAYIAERYAENIRLADLAEATGFSEGHFARIFRAKFGKTFVQYLTEYRMERSKELLTNTHLPIEQIADRVGLNSYSYFCTCFKRVCGISPGAYRNLESKILK